VGPGVDPDLRAATKNAALKFTAWFLQGLRTAGHGGATAIAAGESV